LAGGRTLAEVRIAAGHTSLLTTSAYLHVAVDDDGKVGNLFGVLPPPDDAVKAISARTFTTRLAETRG